MTIAPGDAVAIVLKRRRMRRKFSAWARHNGYEPALHHRLLMSKLVKVSRGSRYRGLPYLGVGGRVHVRTIAQTGASPTSRQPSPSPRPADRLSGFRWLASASTTSISSINPAIRQCRLSALIHFPVNKSSEIATQLCRRRNICGYRRMPTAVGVA